MSTHLNLLGGDVPRVDALAGTGATVWSLDTTLDVVGGHRVDEALPILDTEERERAARFVRAADRRRYLASHLGLRVLLGAYSGLDPAAVTLVREKCPCCGEPHGRPAVSGGTPHFSLSHSEDVAYFAFAHVPVGVDVEVLPSAAALADVLGSLHPAETAELTALAEPERRPVLARVWARKEACLKATGTGLALGLVEPYVGCAPTPAPVPGWTLTDLPAPPGFAAALALRADRAL